MPTRKNASVIAKMRWHIVVRGPPREVHYQYKRYAGGRVGTVRKRLLAASAQAGALPEPRYRLYRRTGRGKAKSGEVG